ncbi:hypothetical protein Pmani_007886 [Petrolisthes manimaculis]|uniref:Uncharacterized protein n=1 Tax=Petrolisthes manimaculis TaxID=1843537 RepID=A0AAE1Q823_9EUCA|nr:hypothetical protein Pmani_007886 [Petrolisthes manimaculis]
MPRPKKHVYKLRQNAALGARAASRARRPPNASPPVAPTSSPFPASSSSSQFRKSLVEKECIQEGIHKTALIIDEETVTKLVRNMACTTCFEEKVNVKFTHHQIDTYLTVT